MSDEPSSSTAAHQTTTDNVTRNESRVSSGRDAAHERRQRNKRLFNKKREAFLADLMRNVDILIYAELSVIYYMDCSFLRFLMRAFVQFVLLTPKPSIFPDPPHQSRPIGMIIGTNILCFILHAYFARPEAGEATRGYLHGGLAMDFIGQKGPTSKIHLLCLDVLVLILQLVHIGILSVKKKAKAAADGPATAASTTPAIPAAPSLQNLDFEERGQLRSDHQQVDIELQELNPDSTLARRAAPQVADEAEGADEDGEGEERQRLLQTTETPRSDRHIFDAFNSGEIMVADLNLYNIVREQFMLTRQTVEATQSGDSSTSGISSAGFTGTGLNFRFRIGNRIWGV
ncbi:hypothetical protein MBLNU457_1460t1 [Dothideomycetes sp. NU457]